MSKLSDVIQHVNRFLDLSGMANVIVSRKMKNVQSESLLKYSDVLSTFKKIRNNNVDALRSIPHYDLRRALERETRTYVDNIRITEGSGYVMDDKHNGNWIKRIEFDGKISRNFSVCLEYNGNPMYTIDYAYISIMKYCDIPFRISIPNYYTNFITRGFDGNMKITFVEAENIPDIIDYEQLIPYTSFGRFSKYIMLASADGEPIEHVIVNDVVIYPKTLDGMYSMFMKEYQPKLSDMRPPNLAIIIVSNTSEYYLHKEIPIFVNNKHIEKSLTLKQMELLSHGTVTTFRCLW